MKQFILVVFLLCPVAVYSAEKTEPLPTQTAEPKFYEHYLSLMRMQERLAGRSLEEQARLQPQLQRAEQQACDRAWRDRHNEVQKEEYRQHGDDQFLVFAQYFEQYCETIR